MSPRPKVLFVLTSHDKLGDTGKPTGWYLPEFAHPYQVLSPHVDCVVASPLGGAAPLDPGSVEATEDDADSVSFLKTQEALWKNTEKLSSFLGRAKEFDAVFFVGGHGPMFDLAKDAVSHQLINEFHTANKVISAVCHGPAALTHVKLPSGGYLLDGQPVTGFSNVEEDQVGATAAMPFKLEDALRSATGGRYEKAAEPWGPKVVIAGNGKLLTGQNPRSAAPLAKAVYEAISA
ncbi:MAG: hypothetical protein M1818_000693 [Claussenomyces sp. TS43310]|nr:MAG: hypothetical protein M1818_000693 [Claussenomyces sp. TS43310]